ncbi:hypothetical protein SteCoe_20941 [Stentor coeruleus]|uniref:Uncharacterized protein n=1 Tax=Stentor coeruleus TaxID=5963 RepID=A0A1R2BQR6_9CILI|nr:hypothetical protein SteCoe_20941 [Stentor coeruleus]
MNMKLYEKSRGIKRVFVSIREQPSAQIPCKLNQPKPPTQPARFIRRKQDASRCHTPDQGGGKPPIQPISQKPSYRRSLSPFINPCQKDTICTPYFKPKENESLLSIPPIEKEDVLCMPYELVEEKLVPTRTVRISIRNQVRNIDLKKGSFSKKQIVSEAVLPSKRESLSTIKMGSHGLMACDESTTVNSRTPSPVLCSSNYIKAGNVGNFSEKSMLPPRNNRCMALSKNFKINKNHLVSEAERQNRAKSVENEEEIEAPWQRILKDLENLL